MTKMTKEEIKSKIREEAKRLSEINAVIESYENGDLTWTETETTLLYLQAVQTGDVEGLQCGDCDGPLQSDASIIKNGQPVIWTCYYCDVSSTANVEVYDRMRNKVEQIMLRSLK